MPIPGPHAAQAAEHAPPSDVARERRARVERPVAPPAGAPGMTVYGYWPYWESDVSERQLAGLTRVAVFDVSLNSDGTLGNESVWTDYAPSLVPLAHSYGVAVDLCVTAFDSSTMESVLGSSARRAAAIDALAALVEAQGADGVNVDFEGLPSSQRDNFVAFVQELQSAVGAVYLAMPVIDWAGSYDYDQLAAASDGLFIMGYEFYGSWGNPGPNDPLEGSDTWGSYSLAWSLDDYRTYGAPDDKLIFGLPLYGHTWEVSDNSVPTSATGDAWSITSAEATAAAEVYGREYDDASECAYYLGDGEQTWYDDTATIQTRVAWARAEGLQGVGFWALGYESDDLWDMLATETADGGGGGGAGGGGGEDTDAATDSPTRPPSAGVTASEDPGGCGCHGAPVSAGWLGLGVATLLVRRRR